MNRRSFLKHSLLAGTTLLTASYSTFIERNIVQINHYTIPISNLPPSFHGFRIAHLTDLHYGFLVSQSFLKGVITKTNALSTDMVVCTGDYVHGKSSKKEIDTVWPILAKLRAKEGVYSVLGNHDHWAHSQRSFYWLNKTGQDLRHRCTTIHRGDDSIVIGGSGDLREDELRIDETFSGTDPNAFKILLAHNRIRWIRNFPPGSHW